MKHYPEFQCLLFAINLTYENLLLLFFFIDKIHRKNDINNIILFVFLYFIGSHLRFKWMSSSVHFTIGLRQFIYQRTLEKKKEERIQQHRPPTAVVQHLAFFPLLHI